MSLDHILQVFHTLFSKNFVGLDGLFVLEFGIESFCSLTFLLFFSLLNLFFFMNSIELGLRLLFFLIIGSRNFGQMSYWGCRVSNSFSICLFLLFLWLLLRSFFFLSSFYRLPIAISFYKLIRTCWRLLWFSHGLTKCLDEVTSLVLGLKFISISWLLAVCALASLVRINLYELFIISICLWLFELVQFDSLSWCWLVISDAEGADKCEHRQDLLRSITIHKFSWFVKYN